MSELIVSSELCKHPKLKDLADEFGGSAVASLFGLWLWCAHNNRTKVSRMELLDARWETDSCWDTAPEDKEDYCSVYLRSRNPDDQICTIYIDKLVSMGIVARNRDEHHPFTVKNPFKPKSNEPDQLDIERVIEGYLEHHPKYRREALCHGGVAYSLIRDRLAEGWPVADLILAAYGIKGREYYIKNHCMAPEYVYRNGAKVQEHINAINNKPVTERRTGHHSGSKGFKSGRTRKV